MKPDIKSLTIEELQEAVEELHEKSYRASQLFHWLHSKGVSSFDEMTNLPKAFLQKLKEDYDSAILNIEKEEVSKEDGTRKFLYSLRDGNLIECVWMEYRLWNTVCVSSQVGCPMGCKFCASTLKGWIRNLTAGEMLEEVYLAGRRMGKRVSNVVVMGTGEPLNNYENLIKFISLLTDEKGLNLSERNITVSTCGLIPEIERLAKEKLQITLAVSLHAPNDEKRLSLMPVAAKYPINELIKACKSYFKATGRRVTFEYALISGVNDGDREARELSKLLHSFPSHVNLIPVNPVLERGFAPSPPERVRGFKTVLEKNRINVTIRRELGSDIDGACGQLRLKQLLGTAAK